MAAQKTRSTRGAHDAPGRNTRNSYDAAGKRQRGTSGSTSTRSSSTRSSSTRSRSTREPQEPQRRIPTWALPVGIVVALLIFYIGGIVHFSSTFLPNTKVNGEDISGMTTAQLAAAESSRGLDYHATVAGQGLSFEFGTEDIDLVLDGEGFADDVMAKQAGRWVWPIEYFGKHEFTVPKRVLFNEDKARSMIEEKVTSFNEEAEPPTEADVVYDKDANTYHITDEKIGTALDSTVVCDEVFNAVRAFGSKVDLGENALKQPVHHADDPELSEALEQANTYVALSIPLTVNGEVVEKVAADRIATWVSFDDTFKTSINDEEITKWTRGDFSKKNDTVGAKRTYKRPDGKSFTVPACNNDADAFENSYGWYINGADLGKALAAQVKNLNEDPIEIPMSRTAAKWNPGHNDWPNRYIDVDLSAQHARFYDENNKVIWESDFVSGKADKKHETPTGVFTINEFKATKQKLIGLDDNNDGKPDYETPVDYWMPFINNLVAFHDAPWRGEFGGSVYKSNGSHGCVNLPAKKAKELYGLSEVGDVVVVHK